MSRSVKIGRRELISGGLGSLVTLVVALFFWISPPAVSERLNQPAIDVIASILPPPATDAIAVVDIDSASLRQFEGRRLSRLRLAELIEEVYSFGASAIAVDLVLEPPCAADQPDVRKLVAAISTAPVSMGFLLSGEPTTAPPVRSPVALGADVRLPQAWTAAGAEMSCIPLTDAATGISALSLAGDFDARIRSVPAVIAVQDRPYPSLAVDAIRLSQKSGSVLVFGDPPQLRVGDVQARLDRGGNIRLRFSTAAQQFARTIAASDVLVGNVDPVEIAGKTVFIGSSAAELGGLRPIPGNPLKASVQIHADLATNLLLGSSPHMPDWARQLSTVAAVLAGIMLAFVAVTTKPVVTAAITLFSGTVWLIACIAFHHLANVILDPLAPVLSMTAGAVASSAIQFSAVRKAETIIRQRFEQRLPGAVVKKLVAEPDLLKLKGEQRIATSMFTDVEGFTTTTERISPTEMIGLLDRYFEGLTGIIIAHGGMIDKTIGDGIHALFNAPVDLEGHADVALSCAREILAFSENFRHSGFAAEAGFGRTRIGIETGEVVLGDVGVADRVDYTAFGSSVNTAARLQDANKQFGTSILLGEHAKAMVSDNDLEDMGEIELRGIGTVRAYGVRPNADQSD
ncbi:CHASE2 domain-containing protein [Hoeflea sp. TYP-13]|uniref:CHASE2 domain-containing protein n=1 Tax=Hoeflea sp. TYP-13 TaxID=3230023 RepID=UPI0034C65A41